MLRIDFSAAAAGARIAALQGLVWNLDSARPAVGGRPVAPVPGRFLPLRLRLLVAAVDAGPLEHLGGPLGRGRAQQLAQLGQCRLLLLEKLRNQTQRANGVPQLLIPVLPQRFLPGLLQQRLQLRDGDLGGAYRRLHTSASPSNCRNRRVNG